jgi:spore coat protein H
LIALIGFFVVLTETIVVCLCKQNYMMKRNTLDKGRANRFWKLKWPSALAFLLAALVGPSAHAQSTKLYDETAVHRLEISIHPDTLQYIYDHIYSDDYRMATFVFDDGELRDTVEQVGFRLRGNTSRGAAKKSFKISFNEFVSGRKYQGVKKLNLIGMHNDPTLIRQKLYYDLWNDLDLPNRRVNFLRLYINGSYYGLYASTEEMDKEWLDRVFDEKKGNLYKCTWPADLVFHGSDQQAYKNIMHSETERAYELKTNEDEDDYSDLVELVTTLNMAANSTFVELVQQQINVEHYLKALALDVATGNWDNYAYNKNNYYLYHNQSTGQFEFISYDTDNTCGIDWLGIDWATRDANNWIHPNEPRPLAAKLLAVPQFRSRYETLLDSITQHLTKPDIINPRMELLHGLVAPYRAADTYANLDYGYTYNDFLNGMNASIDGHTPYGLKPFFAARYAATAGQLTTDTKSVLNAKALGVEVLGNPLRDKLVLRAKDARGWPMSLVDLQGQLLWFGEWQRGAAYFELDCSRLPKGLYLLGNDQFQLKLIVQ